MEIVRGKVTTVVDETAEASHQCCELIICGFKKFCAGGFRYEKADLPCTELCQCGEVVVAWGGGVWLR